ncbi:MAG: hypothetical protein OEL83_16175 [Desulforhopalus sp.]|nr:hypothetical protein [Desulforhopalus sp.]
MLYIERNEQGEIIAVKRDAGELEKETAAASGSDILEFLSANASKDSMLELLAMMDSGIVRIVEDLIDVLIKKNLIMFSELPHEAQEKIFYRKQIRQRIKNETIIVDDEDVL